MNDGVAWQRMRVLHAVARAGSIAGAAQALGLTGPAVSQQLRRLESEVHATIVEPAGRGIRLTSDGTVLAHYAAAIAELMHEADAALHRTDSLTGVIRMGCVASALRDVVATELARLSAEHPGVTVVLSDGEAVDHVQQLAEGHLDLVVAESWSPNPLRLPSGLRSYSLSIDEAYLAMHVDHPRSRDERVDLRDFEPDVWTTCAEGSDAHTALTQAAHARGIDIDIRFHVADHLTQIDLVSAGIAVACVPESARQHIGNRRVCAAALIHPLHRELLLVRSRSSANRAVEHVAKQIIHTAHN